MSDDPIVLIAGGKRGRPRSTDPGSRVSTWIPARYHDQLIRIANERDISVSAVVNKVLTKALNPSGKL